MNTGDNTKEMAATYARLVEAFAEHGTCWYEDRGTSYSLWLASEVEKLLQQSQFFGDCRYSDAQVEAVSSLIAQAANEAGNCGWIGHPDDDDGDLAVRDVSVLICNIVEG